MASFDASLLDQGNVGAKLTSLKTDLIPGLAKKDALELAEELKREFEDTSPVDTGEYQASWEIIDGGPRTVLITNTADHAIHLIFPNRAMIGSRKADLPAEGVIHNIRGIIEDKKSERQGIVSNLREIFKL